MDRGIAGDLTRPALNEGQVRRAEGIAADELTLDRSSPEVLFPVDGDRLRAWLAPNGHRSLGRPAAGPPERGDGTP